MVLADCGTGWKLKAFPLRLGSTVVQQHFWSEVAQEWNVPANRILKLPRPFPTQNPDQLLADDRRFESHLRPLRAQQPLF
jgi:hypothetical protein